MQLTLLKSKIHRATVTGASLHYEGSLTVSSDLAELVELREFENILVGNLSNGERFETYVIYGERQKSFPHRSSSIGRPREGCGRGRCRGETCVTEQDL